MDRYLATGDEAWLRRVALYGYRGDLREDRQDEVPGWTDDSHSEFTKTILDEAQWFLRQLRTINEELPDGEPRLAWFGYDLSFRPGGGYADAAELLAPHDGDPLVDEIRERMARVPGESRIEEAARIEALVAVLDARREKLVALLGDQHTLELRRSLQRMADAFRFIDAMQDLRDFDADAIAAALAVRERRMDHNIDEHLAGWPADEKIILLGHALHLSKDSESIQTRDFGPMWKSIGTHVARKLPGQVYAVWLLHHRGQHGQARAVPPVQPFVSPRGSVERQLTRIHPILMLPLGSGDPREAWLGEERVFSHSGAPARARSPDRWTACSSSRSRTDRGAAQVTVDSVLCGRRQKPPASTKNSCASPGPPKSLKVSGQRRMRSSAARSSRATSWSSAMRGRAAAPACRKCSASRD